MAEANAGNLACQSISLPGEVGPGHRPGHDGGVDDVRDALACSHQTPSL